MKFIHFSVSLILVLFYCTSTTAQSKVQAFAIPFSKNITSNSHYNALTFLDSRDDTSSMGIVQVGAFNAKAWVKPLIPLDVQLKKTLSSLIDSSALSGEILFQLRVLSFYEMSKGFSETGYCSFAANLYAKNGSRYLLLGTIDTLLTVKNGIDVTTSLLNKGGNLIVQFIQANLPNDPEHNTQLTYTQLTNIDSIEKINIPLYNHEQLKDGMYYTFESFALQIPDSPIEIELKKDQIKSVKHLDEKGNWEKARPNKFYAFIYNGMPYISTQYGYYPLSYHDDNFYFTGKVDTYPSLGSAFSYGMMFGAVGGAISGALSSTGNSQDIYLVKINHRTGNFIRVQKIIN